MSRGIQYVHKCVHKSVQTPQRAPRVCVHNSRPHLAWRSDWPRISGAELLRGIAQGTVSLLALAGERGLLCGLKTNTSNGETQMGCNPHLLHQGADFSRPHMSAVGLPWPRLQKHSQ